VLWKCGGKIRHNIMGCGELWKSCIKVDNKPWGAQCYRKYCGKVKDITMGSRVLWIFGKYRNHNMGIRVLRKYYSKSRNQTVGSILLLKSCGKFRDHIIGSEVYWNVVV
jgi:hypothetical protein